MTAIPAGDPLTRFERELEGWGGRPPRVAPGAARARVLASLPERGRGWPWPRLAASAALLVALMVSVWLGSPRPAGEAPRTASLATPAPLDPDTVVWQLDERTTVYFVLRPGKPGKGGVS